MSPAFKRLIHISAVATICAFMSVTGRPFVLDNADCFAGEPFFPTTVSDLPSDTNADMVEVARSEQVLQRISDLENRVLEYESLVQQQSEQLDTLLNGIPSNYSSAEGSRAVDQGSVFTSESLYPKYKLGGQYRLMYNSNNFDFHQPQLTDNQKSGTFFNQRFRTWLTIETSENIRGYLQAEMGHILWGDDNLDFPKTYSVASPRDLAGVELRYGYLEYENIDIGLLRAGIQGWNDPYGQVLASADWDFSVGGLLWEYGTNDDIKLQSGVFQLTENSVRFADDAYLLISDAEWNYDECQRIGISAYYLDDRGRYSYPTLAPYESAWDMWLGLRGSRQIGIGAVNSFVIYNSGERRDSAISTYSHDGVALKLELANVNLGPGRWSTQALYSSGRQDPNSLHSNEFRTIAQSAQDNFGSQGYWSYLIISSPHGPSDVSDLGVSLQNRGLGLMTLQTKYELPISAKLTSVTSGGWLQSDGINPNSNSRDMGTELVQSFNYHFGPGLSTDFGGAVLFTGDFYRDAVAGTSPDDVYELFSRVQLDF